MIQEVLAAIRDWANPKFDRAVERILASVFVKTHLSDAVSRIGVRSTGGILLSLDFAYSDNDNGRCVFIDSIGRTETNNEVIYYVNNFSSKDAVEVGDPVYAHYIIDGYDEEFGVVESIEKFEFPSNQKLSELSTKCDGIQAAIGYAENEINNL